MPIVAYYLGRPAHIWIAAMAHSARETAANPASTAPRPARDPRRPHGEGRSRRPAHTEPRP